MIKENSSYNTTYVGYLDFNPNNESTLFVELIKQNLSTNNKDSIEYFDDGLKKLLESKLRNKNKEIE